jgi:hypothetical protein
MKQIKNILVIVAMICSQLCVSNNTKATNPTKGVEAIGGSIRYTLHIGSHLITTDTLLTDDSYIYLDKESSIAIADPKEQFHIGIVRKGKFTTERIMQGNQEEAYTLANYLVYDEHGKTMQAIPFEKGFVNITTNDSGTYTIRFMYMLKEKSTGKLITLEGEARFHNLTVALQ